MKSIFESMSLFEGCDLAKADVDKALSIGGEPDAYRALGAMYSGCGDFTSSIKSSRMARE